MTYTSMAQNMGVILKCVETYGELERYVSPTHGRFATFKGAKKNQQGNKIAPGRWTDEIHKT